MSINEIPRAPEEKRTGIIIQGTFGTAAADGSTAIELDCEQTEFVPDIKKIDIPGSHGSRTKRDQNNLMHTKYASPTLPLTLFAKLQEIDIFTYLAMQNVSEDSTAPFGKTFTFSTSQPNFQSNAGLFVTAIERDPSGTSSYKGKDMIAQTLTYSLTPDEPLKLTMTLQGIGTPEGTSDPSGTWSRTIGATTAAYFWQADFDTIEIDFGSGTANFHLEEFELTISHELSKIGQNNSGDFQTFGMGKRSAMFKIKAVKDSDWNNVYANWKGNTAITMRIGSGSSSPGGATADLDFAFRGKIDAGAQINDTMLKGEFSGEILDTDSGTAGLTIIVATGSDRTW